MKYKTVEVNGIVLQVAKTTELEGYTEGVIEIMWPSDEELAVWSDAESKQWTKENNKRMRAICKFLNENNL